MIASATHIRVMLRHILPAPSPATFERLADAAIAAIPAQLRAQLDNVSMQIAEFATAEQLASVGLTNRWELSGLYEGVPLPDQTSWDSGRVPPRIWLFRQPLLAEWRDTGVTLRDLVTHVVVHEAGHHFGFSDDDMHALEGGG